METLREILVGLTFDAELNGPTRTSARAALQAERLALSTGARVTLVHCDEKVPTASGGALLGAGEDPRLPRAAEALLADLRRTGVRCELVIEHERPWEALVRRVLAGQGDLVVVGRRERAGGERSRYGSNTHELLQRCPAPVWVVHPRHELLQQRVLAATDGTAVGRRVLQLAARVAGWSGAELHVVHALEIGDERRVEEGASRPRRAQEALFDGEAEARAEIAAALLDQAGAEPRVHVRPGDAWRVLLASVEELEPELLVMGSLSRDLPPGRWLGSTAEQLLERIDCALLAVKPAGFVGQVPA